MSRPDPIELSVPNLNRMYVHPLFPLAALLIHTSATVLAAIHLSPFFLSFFGVSIAVVATAWLIIGTIVLVMAFVRQYLMEGSVVAE